MPNVTVALGTIHKIPRKKPGGIWGQRKNQN